MALNAGQQHLQLQDGDHAGGGEAAAQVEGQIEQIGQAEGEGQESTYVSPVRREPDIRNAIGRQTLIPPDPASDILDDLLTDMPFD